MGCFLVLMMGQLRGFQNLNSWLLRKSNTHPILPYCGFQNFSNLRPKKFPKNSKILCLHNMNIFPAKKEKEKESPSDENLKFLTFLGNNYSCSAAIITPPIILQLLKNCSLTSWLAGQCGGKRGVALDGSDYYTAMTTCEFCSPVHSRRVGECQA